MLETVAIIAVVLAIAIAIVLMTYAANQDAEFPGYMEADLVLVGLEDRYGIVRNGAAGDCPTDSASFAELAADPDTIFASAEGRSL